MPIYEFTCSRCKLNYDTICSYDETGLYKKIKCPNCNSKKKTKLMSTCAFNFSNPIGTDRWNSENNGHDYRFRHNLPQVLDQRRKAEEASHVGATPYNEINDLNSDSSWGEVQ